MAGVLTPLVSGISDGVLLFLIASGLTLIFGVMRLINMAHGAYYMVGAYLLYILLRGDAVSLPVFIVAVLAVAVLTGVLGFVTERIIFTRLYGQAPINSMLGTYALLLILQGIAERIWGTTPVVQPQPPSTNTSFVFAGIHVPRFSLLITVVGIIAMVLISLALSRSTIGKQIRAVAEDRWMASLLGIPVARISVIVIVIGTFLAGLGGALAAPVQGIVPNLAVTPVLAAFAVVIVGGLGSVYGAGLAALLLAILNSYVITYAPVFANYTIYIAMLVLLLFRPQGLMGSSAQLASE